MNAKDIMNLDPKEVEKFYNIRHVLKKGADITMVVSERANGKTFSTMVYLLNEHYQSGYQTEFVYVRRRQKHIARNAFLQMWDGILANGKIEEITNGEYDRIVYKHSENTFYLARIDEDGKIVNNPKPFGYTACLSASDEWLGREKPFVEYIWFEEFIPKSNEIYVDNELTAWISLQSSIIRTRDNVKIILTGNTTSPHSIYFTFYQVGKLADMEFGETRFGEFTHPRDQKVKLKVITELANGYEKIAGEVKPSDKYFLPEVGKSMTTNGEWDIAEYYKLPPRFRTSKVKNVFSYHILYDGEYYKATVKLLKDEITTHHELTTLTEEPQGIVFKMQESLNPYHFINPLTPIKNTKKTNIIHMNYKNSRVTFDTDETGAVIKQYILDSSNFNALYI